MYVQFLVFITSDDHDAVCWIIDNYTTNDYYDHTYSLVGFKGQA